MERYVEERTSKFDRLKLKGRIMQDQGMKKHNSEKIDHTHDHGKRSQKVNERIARRLRREERNKELNNIVVDDEYEESIELELLKEKALKESLMPKIGLQEVVKRLNDIESMEQEEKELLQQVQQIRLQRGKKKLRLIANGENISISFEEWKAIEEQILLKASNNNLGGIVAWKNYKYSVYGDYKELYEYAIRLQDQLLHIYKYEDKIQAELEQLTEERKASLERKATKDSKTDGAIGWKRILGNQYSLEEAFDVESVLEMTQLTSTKASHLEQVLSDVIVSRKSGKGTIESAQIILENMQNL